MFIDLKNITLEDCKETLTFYCNCLIELISESEQNSHFDEPLEGKIILQMLFTKCINLKNSLNGLHFEHERLKLNKIIDPIIITTLVRNIYETICLFNLLYVYTNDESQRELIYLLWQNSGYRYRQKDSELFVDKSNLIKLKNESLLIEDIYRKIKNNKTFITLNTNEQKKIEKFIKNKNYLFEIINNNEVKQRSWSDLIKNLNIQAKIFERIYTSFSLYSHPSYISVENFENFFSEDCEGEQIVKTDLIRNFLLLSVFIGDLINIYPNYKNAYLKINEISQKHINFYYFLARQNDIISTSKT